MMRRIAIALAAFAVIAFGGYAYSDYTFRPYLPQLVNFTCSAGNFISGIVSGVPICSLPNVSQSVPTNAALKALTGGISPSVIRTGYAADGDTPPAIYRWNGASSCTDDGGSCIQPNIGSGRWILVSPPRVPAGVFGALCNGDGSHDDTASLNAAIAYVQTITGPGNTLLLSGRCRISGALTVTSNMTIAGSSMDSTFLFPTSSSISCINFNPANDNQQLNLIDFSCAYASRSAVGAVGIQYGNNAKTIVDSRIHRINITNATIGLAIVNPNDIVVSHSKITAFYSTGITISAPALPDGGGIQIHDNFIYDFSPASNSFGIQWFSGGAVDIHNNKIFGENGIYVHESLQTTEYQITNNLIVATGSPTAAITIDALSASFTCSQSGTTMTASSVTGTIVTGGATSIGQTITGTGISGFINAQLTGTPGGAGTYTLDNSATAGSTTCKSTLHMYEMIITSNVFDGWERALLVPVNTGGTFLHNLVFHDNGMSSASGSAQNQIAIASAKGVSIGGNTFLCNGTCSGRAMFIDATTDKVTVWQPTSSKIGSWGAADSISSTNTCGMLGNALVTTC
jgi:hypothetical protein